MTPLCKTNKNNNFGVTVYKRVIFLNFRRHIRKQWLILLKNFFTVNCETGTTTLCLSGTGKHSGSVSRYLFWNLIWLRINYKMEYRQTSWEKMLLLTLKRQDFDILYNFLTAKICPGSGYGLGSGTRTGTGTAILRFHNTSFLINIFKSIKRQLLLMKH
jgi:hypothetical protein